MYDRLFKLLEELVVMLGKALAEAWHARDLPPEGALWRGWKDTKRVSTHWWRFRLPAAALTVGFAVWSALLPSQASGAERAALAVGGTLGGALIVGALAFVVLTATAPLRQRDEHRAELADIEEDRSEKTSGVEALVAALTGVMHEGSQVLERLDRGESKNFMGEANDWTSRARDEIEAVTDPTEPALFSQAGRGNRPDEQLRAKVEYIREKLLPRAREGLWSFQADAVEKRRQSLALQRAKAELAQLRAREQQLEIRRKAGAKAIKNTVDVQAELDAMQPHMRALQNWMDLDHAVKMITAQMEAASGLARDIQQFPRDMRAAAEPEVEQWYRGVLSALPVELKARFEAHVPYAEDTLAARRIDNVLDRGRDCLAELLRETTLRRDRAREALDKAD